MNRAARWAGALLALVAATAHAQGAGHAPVAPSGTPDVPAGEATLHGQIVNTSRPAANAGLPVLLYALPDSGPPGLREGVSDAQGRFVFANVSNDPATVYLVGVRAGDVPFGVRVRFKAGEREKTIELPISDPTSDAHGVSVDAALWQLERGCGSLVVSESHSLRNATSRVIYVPESERSGREPLFKSTLPQGASGFEGHAGTLSGGLALEGREVVFWGPLYPGEQALEFSWALPAAAPTLAFSRQFDAGVKRLSLRTPVGAPAPKGAGLGASRSVSDDGRSWREQSAGSFAPGASIELAVELPPVVTSDALALSEARVWLELDDAALQVDTQIGLTVPQSTPLASDSGAPLLCLALPHGATGLRFSSQTLDLGLAVDASDQLAVRGPLPPGPSVFALRYHLPATHGLADLALRFPLRLPQLSVFLTDTGVSAQTTRLHRRRPFRSDDRSYMHLEAFELAADEPVTLSLARLAPALPLPVAARAGFALLLAGAATAFLIAPLRSTRAEPPLVSRRAAHAAAERESVLAALRDLDEDFATGKLDVADHAQMRSELRARAVALLAAERDALAAPDPAPARSATGCPSCAAEIAPGARFCSQCGIALAATARDPGTRAG
jgi:hypothetical protein